MRDFNTYNGNEFVNELDLLSYFKEKYEPSFLPGNDIKKYDSIRKMQDEVYKMSYHQLIKLRESINRTTQSKETIMFKNKLCKMLDMEILKNQIDSIFLAYQ